MEIQVQLALLLFCYKVLSLLTGLAMAYMGYRLFLADKVNPAGDFSVKGAKYALSLRGGAPGVFFSLFGTILVCFTIFQGLKYDLSDLAGLRGAPPSNLILPDTPPTEDLPSKGK